MCFFLRLQTQDWPLHKTKRSNRSRPCGREWPDNLGPDQGETSDNLGLTRGGTNPMHCWPASKSSSGRLTPNGIAQAASETVLRHVPASPLATVCLHTEQHIFHVQSVIASKLCLCDQTLLLESRESLIGTRSKVTVLFAWISLTFFLVVITLWNLSKSLKRVLTLLRNVVLKYFSDNLPIFLLIGGCNSLTPWCASFCTTGNMLCFALQVSCSEPCQHLPGCNGQWFDSRLAPQPDGHNWTRFTDTFFFEVRNHTPIVSSPLVSDASFIAAEFTVEIS